jgi:RND family efflux transporter MFP subunit
MRNKIYFFILTFFLLKFLLSCSEKVETEITEEPAETVTVVVAAEEEITPEIKSFGTISYFRKADISVAIDGKIKWISKEEGDQVYAGEIIAEIENIQLTISKKKVEAAIRQAESALELAEAKLWEARLQVEARLISLQKTKLEIKQKEMELEDMKETLSDKEKLFEVGGITEEALEDIRLQYETAKIDYETSLFDMAIKEIGLRDKDILSFGYSLPETEEERIEMLVELNTQTLAAEMEVALSQLVSAKTELESIDQLLEETKIRSPVTGIIGAKYMETGERIQSGTKLFTVFDLSSVFAVFPVQESDAVQISEGMDVDVTVDALQGKELTARIYLIYPTVDPQTGNLSIKALLTNEGLVLKPGMFARIRVISGEPRMSIMVPKTCLFHKEGNKGEVYLVIQDRLFLKEVIVGVERGEKVEIIEGLKVGDVVVDAPSPILKEGVNVNVNVEM